MKPLRLGTRGSALALWQARTVAERIQALGRPIEIVTITTKGDRRQTESLAELSAESGKGVFTKEIEDALLRDEIDLAVHSAKDMAAVPPNGLGIGAVLEREDPRDALVLGGAPEAAHFSADLLSATPRLGTGSPRRVAQLRRTFRSATFQPVRGNVDTRLRKLDSGEVDALVLACAGLRRLGLTSRITAPIPVDDCVPAPGQGIIAIEMRAHDGDVAELLSQINDPLARTALVAEQAVVAALGGGCQLPLGAFAEIRGSSLHIRGIAASSDGTHAVVADVTGDPADAAALGARLAGELAAGGARELLHS